MLRLASLTSTGLGTVEYTYDEFGKLTKVKRGSTEYNQTYDDWNRPFRTKIGNVQLWVDTYDDYGRHNTTTFNNGFRVRYTFDALDRVDKIYYKINDTESLAYRLIYNGNGELYEIRNYRTNRASFFEYDHTGRCMASTERSFTGTGDPVTYGSVVSSYKYQYDACNNLTKLTCSVMGSKWNTVYTYDKDNRPKTTTLSSGTVVTNTYNSLGFLTKKTIGLSTPYETKFTYMGLGDGKYAPLITYYKNGTEYATHYAYDDNGNITTIERSDGANPITYEYDTANRLTRENNSVTNQTVTYEYDTWGNILKKRIYAYTTATDPGTPTGTNTYTYGNSAWGDQLTSYNGMSITYDNLGNPLNYRNNYTFTWRGKQMISASNGTNSLTFEYNEDGLRQSKTCNNVTTDYYYNGSVLIGMQRASTTYRFSYDASGNAVSLTDQEGNEYYYLRNAQGDIVKLIDASGATVVQYTYDTWGKKVTTTGTLAGTLGLFQPFRYRGYVYDWETGFYYLQSRYYDPTTGRFISADVLLSTGQGVLGHNCYAYCLDNPVKMKDPAGNCPWFIPLICPVCRGIALAGGVAAIYLSITGDPDLDIWDNKKKAVAIYYDNGNPGTSLAQQAKFSIYKNNYDQWDTIEVQSYTDLQNAWNSISGEVDDVFFFVHSDDEGFYMNKKDVCESDFTGFKPNDSVRGNVYLLSCHAGGFADKFANQIKKPVIATKSAVNYTIVDGQYAPRRSRWDQFWGANKWKKYDYK